MSKLTKKQRKFLKTIENPKQRFEKKIQFKLQNKFDSKNFGLIIAKQITQEHFEKMKPHLSKEELNELTNPNEIEMSLDLFIDDCERWLLQDLDVGTCQGIKNDCIKFKQYELGAKFRDKEIRILSKFDREKLYSFVKKEIINLDTLYKVESYKLKKEIDDIEKEEIIYKSNNSEIPKEFCVEITNENIDIFQKIQREYHKIPDLDLAIGSYFFINKLKSRFLTDLLTVKIVSTEEFLRYIGKEDLIETPKDKFSQFPPKILNDNIIIVDQQTYKVNSIGDIVDKVVSLSLEKLDTLKVNEIEVVNPIELSKKVHDQERNQKLFNYISNEFGVSVLCSNLQEIEDIVIDMIEKDRYTLLINLTK